MTPEQTARIESAIRENESMLVKWLTRRLGDPDAADDVAQSVFLRVWSYAATAMVVNPKALIFKTAGNLAINEMKRRNTFNRRHIMPSGKDDENDAIDNIASAGPTPEKETSLRQDVRKTLEAIENLPESARIAFTLNRFDGLSYREIAKRMKVSESSVEKYMIDALKRLRQALRDDPDP